MVLDGKSLQEYLVKAAFTHGSSLDLTFFPLYINDGSHDVFCNIAINADDTTCYWQCDQASYLWQQLELASELESDLLDTVDWHRKWLAHFSAGKTQIVSFHWSNNSGVIDVKMNKFLRKNHVLLYWG